MQLRVLKADGNFLNGTFPNWFDSFSNLTSLSLRNNLLTGALPSSIQKITTLTDINLSNNRISGKLLDLSGLSSLLWVDLSNNELDSELPKSMPQNVISLVLSNNSFTGGIPAMYAKLNHLQQIDLSSNNLTGTPPTGLFSLPNVSSINLASNMLSGSLSLNLGCGSKLQSVDISNNRLRGALPPCLKNNKKVFVKLGGNCLSTDSQQQHPETFCVEEEKKKSDHKGMSMGILIGVIAGIGVIALVLGAGFLLLCRQYCPRGTSEQHLLQKAVVDSSVTAEILTNASM